MEAKMPDATLSYMSTIGLLVCPQELVLMHLQVNQFLVAIGKLADQFNHNNDCEFKTCEWQA